MLYVSSSKGAGHTDSGKFPRKNARSSGGITNEEIFSTDLARMPQLRHLRRRRMMNVSASNSVRVRRTWRVAKRHEGQTRPVRRG